jgi:uncharacterized protein (TIGR03435 family)
VILFRAFLRPYLVSSVVLLAINSACSSSAQNPKANPSFEVATIKPADQNARGRFIIMQGENRFVAKNYTLKLLIAAAYDVSPKAISVGPAWVESDHYDIEALTPGTTRPPREEQMAMLRALLVDRFKLGFHREPKTLSIYELEVAKGGVKLKQSTAAANEPAALITTVFPDHLHLPARNATMGEFVSVLQRAVLDRPVVDRTGLTAKYDFDLDWAADETQFGGEVPVASADAPSPPFFVAIEQELGLHIEAKRGPVDTLIVDTARQPSAN